MTWYQHSLTFGDPLTGLFSEDMRGIVDNFPAMANGDAGAPRIMAAAHPAFSASDAVILERVTPPGHAIDADESIVGREHLNIVHQFTAQRSGVIRYAADIGGPQGSTAVQFEVRVNWSLVHNHNETSTGAWVPRTYDVTFAAGDHVCLVIRSSGASIREYRNVQVRANVAGVYRR